MALLMAGRAAAAMKPSARIVLSMFTVLALQASCSLVLARPHSSSGSSGRPPCQPRDTVTEQRPRCGKELAEALRDICRFRGGYNEPNAIAHHSFPRSGVATDCCSTNKGCSLIELRQFCRDPGSPRPDCSEESSEEKKSETNDSGPLDSAHQRNLIRSDSEQNETTDRPSAKIPSVVGGRPGASMKQLSRAQYNNMVSVGTISSHGRIPVPIPESRRTHSTSSNAVRTP